MLEMGLVSLRCGTRDVHPKVDSKVTPFLRRRFETFGDLILVEIQGNGEFVRH